MATINPLLLAHASERRQRANDLIERLPKVDGSPADDDVAEALDLLDTAVFELLRWAEQVNRHLAETGADVVESPLD